MKGLPGITNALAQGLSKVTQTNVAEEQGRRDRILTPEQIAGLSAITDEEKKLLREKAPEVMAQYTSQVGNKKDQSKDFTQANQLYNRYDSTGKEIRTLDQGNAITKSFNVKTQNPYDDQALIFSFMKVLDPGSVVREGEFKTAQNNSSLLNSIGANWQNAMTGTGMLLPEQRQKILDSMNNLYKQKMSQYSDLTNQYASAGAKLGFDDPSLFLDYTPEYFSKNSSNVSSSTGMGGSTVRVQAPDGSIYEVDQSDLQAALNEGGKQI
jgi:Spy/CpxP family protein refolding chaperone